MWSDRIYLRCGISLYAGKESEGPNSIRTLGERVVLRLIETIRNKDVTLAFDIFFFTSVGLIDTILPAVTICNSARRVMTKFSTKPQEGEFFKSSSGILTSRWMDTKDILVMTKSNCYKPETTVVQCKQKDGTRHDDPCPEAATMYNKIMGGVDLSD